MEETWHKSVTGDRFYKRVKRLKALLELGITTAPCIITRNTL